MVQTVISFKHIRGISGLRPEQALKTKIADLWGEDTSKLESEYAALSVKIEAAQIVLERLQGETDAAAKREATAEYEAALKAYARKTKTLEKADKKLLEIWQALLAELAAYDPVDNAHNSAKYAVDTARNAAERAGLSWSELGAIQSELQVEYDRPTTLNHCLKAVRPYAEFES